MPAPDSRFVYPRSIQNDIADELACARQRVAQSELWVIDLITRAICDMFFEHDPAFSPHADVWMRRAKYLIGRPPTRDAGEHHHGR